ncbi:MAG TPA: GGDEF domain-containing protein [Spirochaetota bacterium]|nr:GGDEF domain-containing protein [Spirochaetota bacterium]
MNSKRLYFSIILLFSASFIGILSAIFITSFIADSKKTDGIILDDFTYRTLNLEHPHVLAYEKSIEKSRFNTSNRDLYKVIIYRLAGQSYKVFFNDILIGSAGSGINGNIWNSINCFDIDLNLLKDSNKIKIEVVGLYEAGLLSFPIVITGEDKAAPILNWFNFLISLYNISIGCLLVCFFLLMFFSFSTREFDWEFFYFALSNLFLAVYVFDNLSIYKVVNSLIFFKKVVYSSLFLSAGFISLGVYKHFGKKISFYSGCSLFLSIIPILFATNNLFLLKRISTILSAVIFVNIIIWIYVSFLSIKESDFNKVFFVLCIIILSLTSFDIFNNFFGQSNKFNLFSLNVYTFIILAIALTILVFYEYLQLEERVVSEEQKSKIYYELATKDQMTDCYNHQFIVNTLKSLKTSYSLIMFDIDNFKPINDTYGHQSGDFVIKFVAHSIKENVKSCDMVGRYGGDEFVAILPDSKSEEAKKIALSVLEQVREQESDDKGNKLKLSLSIGVYATTGAEEIGEVLRKVDETLYISKNNGKNQVNVFKE